jgi:hypothetical protein
VIHELGERFAERNLFLQVALGLVALSKRFDALVVEHAFAAAGDPLAWEGDDGRDEPVLLFLLGLASFSHRAMGHLDEARRSARPGAPAADAPPPRRGSARDLRKLLV